MKEEFLAEDREEQHQSAPQHPEHRPLGEPGDLLFFRLSGAKTSHVAMYVGRRAFVHAPSSGKRVERVGFDHVYWGPRLSRAGRVAGYGRARPR